MARPKEKFGSMSHSIPQGVEKSVAFENRAKQELEKLRVKVAKALTDDFGSLFEQEEHADLIITNGRSRIRAHKCIFQARAGHLWKDYWITSDGCEKITLTGLTEKQMSDFVRQLYVVSDSSLLIEEFLPFFPNNNDGSDMMSCGTDGNIDHPNSIVMSQPQNLTTEDNEGDLKNADQCHSGGFCLKPIDDTHICDGNFTETDGVGENVCEVVNPHSDIVIPKNNVNVNNVLVTEIQIGFVNGCEDGVTSKNGKNGKLGDQHNIVNEDSHFGEGKSDDAVDSQSSKIGELGIDNGELQEHGRELIMTNNESSGHNIEELSVVKSENLGNVEQDIVKAEVVDEEKNRIVKEQKLDVSSACCVQSIKHDGDIEKESIGSRDDLTSLVLQSNLSEALKVSYALSIPYETCNSLGKDMLRMYLQQQNCDICLCVDGVRFQAHKSVLAARGSYFSAMLGGKWCESEMEEILLQGVSAQAVEQLLLFLYGGVMELCTPSDLMELFIVMDMYGVDTLKLVLEFYIRKDLCHFFHKPCNTCVASASLALNLCNSFYLEELEERCLKWSVKYFTKIWSNKAFAGLPEAVHRKCVDSVMASVTENSVLDMIMECNKLSSSLPRIKWTESILYLTTQLMDSAIEYTSSHFIEVIRAPEFLLWGKVASWKGGALEEIFNSVIDSLPIDTACSAYQTLVDLKASQEALESNDQNVLSLLDTMLKQCEKFLRTHIHQVARSKNWSSVSKSLQSQILENSSYIHLDQLPDPKPRPAKRPFPASFRNRPSTSSASSSSLSSSTSSTRPLSSGNQSIRGSKASQSSVTSQPLKPNAASGIMTSSGQRSSTTSSISSQQVSSRKSNTSLLSSSSPSSSPLKASGASSSPSSLKNKTTRVNPLTKTDGKNKAVPTSSLKQSQEAKTKDKKVENNQRRISPASTLKKTPLGNRRSMSPASNSKVPVKLSVVNKESDLKAASEINVFDGSSIARAQLLESDIGVESVEKDAHFDKATTLMTEKSPSSAVVNNTNMSSNEEDSSVMEGSNHPAGDYGESGSSYKKVNEKSDESKDNTIVTVKSCSATSSQVGEFSGNVENLDDYNTRGPNCHSFDYTTSTDISVMIDTNIIPPDVDNANEGNSHNLEKNAITTSSKPHVNDNRDSDNNTMVVENCIDNTITFLPATADENGDNIMFSASLRHENSEQHDRKESCDSGNVCHIESGEVAAASNNDFSSDGNNVDGVGNGNVQQKTDLVKQTPSVKINFILPED